MKVEDSLGDKVARNKNPCNLISNHDGFGKLLLLATFLAIFLAQQGSCLQNCIV